METALLFYSLALALDAGALWLVWQLTKGNDRYRFAAHPVYAGLHSLAIALFLFKASLIEMAAGGFAAAGAIYSFAALGWPASVLPVYSLADQFSRFMIAPASSWEKPPLTCDQAEAAERKRDYASAEKFYRQTLATNSRLAGPVHGRYGDFLNRQGRPAEAVTQWREALRKNPPPLHALSLAARISEALAGSLADPLGAQQVLEQVLTAHGREKDAEPLRRRLEKLRAARNCQSG